MGCQSLVTSMDYEELCGTLVPRTFTADEPSDARFTHGEAGAQTRCSVGAMGVMGVPLVVVTSPLVMLARGR